MRKQYSEFVFVVLSAYCILVSPSIAHADPVVIDQFSPIGEQGLGCCLGSDFAQTFTVGITGILETVALPLFRPGFQDDFSGQIGVQLRSTVGGVPSESVLAEMVFTKSSLPNTLLSPRSFTTFLTGLNVPIVSGEQLAIVLSNVGHNGQNIGWWVDPTAAYTSGAPYSRLREDTGMAGNQGDVTGPWRRFPVSDCCNDLDFAFFTAVEPAGASAVTPEPSSVLLVGTAILCLMRRRFARRRGVPREAHP